MTFAFARIGAVVAMRVEDYYPKGKRWWVRLHEKGGKRHEMPAHHNLEAYLDAYIEAAGIRDGGKAPLFRSAAGRTGTLTDKADEPGRCLAHDPAPRRRSRHAGQDRLPYLPRHRHHRLSRSRRHAWRTPRPWPRMKARARPSSTIAPATRSRSMRSSGSRFRTYDAKEPIWTTPINRLRQLAQRLWRQLERLHLLSWLSELLGWQKVLISSLAAIFLAVKAVSEQLPTSVIILVAFGEFAAVLIVLDVTLRLRARLSRSKSVPKERLTPPATDAEEVIPASEEMLNQREEMLEGTLTLDTITWKTRVPFEHPFLRKPKVSLWRADGQAVGEPSIDEVTPDYFTVSMNNSDLRGQWTWRARGVVSRVNRRRQ